MRLSTPCLLIAVILFCFLPAPDAVCQQLDNLKNEKPVTLHGNLGANLIFYNASGLTDRMSPFSAVFSGNATLSIYGIALPFTFRLSDKQNNFGQPFNQFGISPKYKWITLHAGYRNIRFSEFSLAGHTFLGGGLELSPGLFRFAAVYGRFKKSSGLYENEKDTLQSFDRMGYAVRIGVGNEKTHVDFILQNIKDDSLSHKINKEGVVRASPEQNAVTGINTRIEMSKTLSFEAEAAISLYTTNALDNTLDGDVGDFLKSFGSFIVVNASSEFATALRSSLIYKSKKFGLKAEFKRIDPRYKSMGAYYFNDDVQNITIAPSLPLFKRKLYLRGSVGLQRDNLKNTKLNTTTRTISSASIAFNPVQAFGIDINYSNYSNNQKAGKIEVIDTLKLYQTTSNISVSPRLFFDRTKVSHQALLLYNRSGLNDKNASTAEFSESVATILNAAYNLNIKESGIGVSFGLNHTLLESFAGAQKVTGATAGASKTWMEGKLQAALNSSLMKSQFNNTSGWIYNHSLTGAWQLKKHHSMRFSFFYISQKYPAGTGNTSFNEFKGDLGYVFTF